MKRELMASAFALFAVLSGGAQAEVKLHRFISGEPTATKQELIARLTGPAMRADRGAFVALFNRELGKSTDKTFDTFDELIEFIKSDEVTVGPCNWVKSDSVQIFGLVSKTRFDWRTRDCYRNGAEKALFYKGRAIFSLDCGNPIKDSREEKIAPAVAPAPAPKPKRSTLELYLMPDSDRVETDALLDP